MEQEVLLGGLKGIERLDEEASIEDFKALLQQHAKWAIGKAARRHRQSAGESEAPDSKDPTDEVLRSGAVTRADELQWLEARIAELPAGERDVVLQRMRGATFEAIAEALGISPSAVRKRYLRAAKKLRTDEA